MYLKFDVTVCLGCGDGGDVVVSAHVTDEEFEQLKKCYAEDGDFGSYPGLEDLYNGICEDAIDECMSYDMDGETNYGDASCIVYMPKEVK